MKTAPEKTTKKPSMKTLAVDEQLKQLEINARALEGEKSFDKSMELFTQSATLAKELITTIADKRGEITEIIRTVDGMMERKLNFNNCEEDEE